MLIYESEGFIEVEAEDIKEVKRSIATVCFGDSEQAGYNVNAVLCEFLGNSQKRCAVAFHSKVLKRSLVFSVKPPDNISPMQNGEEILSELGFNLDSVNLRLSPAMLGVVLQDVPGIATPASARKFRNERSLLLSELQKDVDKDPNSALGKKSALKLASEKRLNERVEELQQILVNLLSPQEVGDGYSAAMEQVKDVTERLEKTEALLEEERKQREFSESITAAAEKRIQELEEILVDVETKSASEIKEKQKAVKLKTQIRELEEQLEGAAAELEEEKSNQEKFIADVKSANSQIAELEEKVRQSENTLDGTLDKLAEEENRNEQLKSHIQKLEEQLEQHGVRENELSELEQAIAELQQELEDSNLKLVEADAQKEELANETAAAENRLQKLEAEKEALEAQLSNEPAVDEEVLQKLQKEADQYKAELHDLSEELLREKSIRKRLERGAVEDDKRIRELEGSLNAATVEVMGDAEDVSAQMDSMRTELHELKRKLLEEQGVREDVEHELEQAHKMIDSLENMLRETSQSQTADSAAQAEYEKQVVKLEAKVELLNEQLKQERARQSELAQTVAQNGSEAASEAEPPQRRPLKKMVTMPTDSAAEPSPREKASRPAKKMPHELRPAPPKGDFFIPDWDLQGLPCESANQVVRAWETVFNVQIALDGYPTQFCMAFQVVLKVGKAKKLYQVFKLKQSKYTLVKVPAAVPKNEDDLKKAINEGLKFLRSCGFEMEEMPKEYVDNSLGSFFLG